MKRYTGDQIFKLIEGEKQLAGDVSKIFISNVKALTEADENSLVWLSPKKKEMISYIATTPAQIIIVANDFDTTLYPDKCFIKVPDPRLAFLRLAALFATKTEWGKHPTAVIHPEAKVHPNTHIGAYTYIGKCEIDEGTIIFGHCYLYDNVSMGKHVKIQSGAIIGSEGFGFQKNAAGEFEKFPHIGGVIIEDHVDIGAGTCIDRGTLSNTIIREWVKINNLVHIAHNVEIGKHTIITSNCCINGSTKIGEHCWLAPSVTTLDNLKIGSYSRLGIGAVITKDVSEYANMIGNPAINFKMVPKKEE